MVQVFIYSPTATKEQLLNSNGYGILEAFEAKVHWEKNGAYYANLSILPTSKNADKFVKLAIVKIPTKHGDQLFRLESPEKTLYGTSAKAWHISYDQDRDMILNLSISAKNGAEALPSILSAGTFENRFSGTSDITLTHNGINVQRASIISALMGTENSFLTRWGGEIERDNFTFNIKTRLGADMGAKVQYRKNLTGLSIVEDTSNLATRIIPTCQDADGNVLMLAETYIDAPTIENYPFPYIKTVNFSDIKVGSKTDGVILYPDNTAARNEMIARVNAMYAGEVGIPAVSVTFNFIDLSKTVEYGGTYAYLEEIYQGDTVTVEYDDVVYKLRVAEYVEDALSGRYDSITIGTAQNTIISTLVSQSTAITTIENKFTTYQQAQTQFSDLVVNALGYYTTDDKQDDGSVIHYEHDQPLLADSTVIYKKTASTFSWSDDGGATWTGMSANGNILAKVLTAIGIDSQWIRSWAITIDAGTNGTITMNPDAPLRITRPPVSPETEPVFIGGITKILDKLCFIAQMIANAENPDFWAQIGHIVNGDYTYDGVVVYKKDGETTTPVLGLLVDDTGGVSLGDDRFRRFDARKTEGSIIRDSDGTIRFIADSAGTRLYDASGTLVATDGTPVSMSNLLTSPGTLTLSNANGSPKLTIDPSNMILFNSSVNPLMMINDSISLFNNSNLIYLSATAGYFGTFRRDGGQGISYSDGESGRLQVSFKDLRTLLYVDNDGNFYVNNKNGTAISTNDTQSRINSPNGNSFVQIEDSTINLCENLENVTVGDIIQHQASTVNSEAGAHGLRYFNSALEYYNGTTWVAI